MIEARTEGARGGRVKARTNPSPNYLPTLARRVCPLDLLDEAGAHRIHDAAITVLETAGIEFRDAVAMADWKRAGANVQDSRARISREALSEQISLRRAGMFLASNRDKMRLVQVLPQQSQGHPPSGHDMRPFPAVAPQLRGPAV